MVKFYIFLKLDSSFRFVVAIFDLVYDVEAIFFLPVNYMQSIYIKRKSQSVERKKVSC